MFGKVPINKWTAEHSIKEGFLNYAELVRHSTSTNAQMKSSRQTMMKAVMLHSARIGETE